MARSIPASGPSFISPEVDRRPTDGEPYGYIYTLSDPRTGEVRYVGQTRSRRQRRNAHVNSPQRCTSDWVAELRAAGLQPVMETVWTVYRSRDMDVAEGWWYHRYLERGAPLLNANGIRRPCYCMNQAFVSNIDGEEAAGYLSSVCAEERGKRLLFEDEFAEAMGLATEDVEAAENPAIPGLTPARMVIFARCGVHVGFGVLVTPPGGDTEF